MESDAISTYGDDAADRRVVAPTRLTGAFIQFDGNTEYVPSNHWDSVVEMMHAAGMDTIIIQWLQHVDLRDPNPANQYDLNFLELASGKDPAGEILKAARKRGMKVLIGLWLNEEWWSKAEFFDAAYFAPGGPLEKASFRIADAAWDRYNKPEYGDSLAGWYIPQETWNLPYTDPEIDALGDCFRRISDHCKKRRGNKHVAISPIFNPKGYPAGTPDEVRRVYTRLLTGAGIDVVMVQDGVGARCWDKEAQIKENVPQYLAAFGDACKEASRNTGKPVKLWGNVESFVQMHGGDRDSLPFDLKPTCLKRLRWQIDAARTSPQIETLVTFAFFHYMNPVTPDDYIYKVPLCERKRLYCTYLREYVPENTSTCATYADDPNCAPITDRYCPP
jgi:hypothetical protein